MLQLSCKLHHACCPLGVMETELSPWILQLEQTVSELMVGAASCCYFPSFSLTYQGSDYTPAVQSSRDSPLSSVSQNPVHSQFGSQPPQQFTGQFLQVPGQPEGGRQLGSQTPPGLPSTAMTSEYPHSDTGSQQSAPSHQLAGDYQLQQLQQSIAHPLSVNQYPPPPVQDSQQPTVTSGGDSTMTAVPPAQDQYGVTQQPQPWNVQPTNDQNPPLFGVATPDQPQPWNVQPANDQNPPLFGVATPDQPQPWNVQPANDQNTPLFGVTTNVAPDQPQQQEQVAAFSDGQGYNNIHQNFVPQRNNDMAGVSSNQPPPLAGSSNFLQPTPGHHQLPDPQNIPSSFTSSYPDNTHQMHTAGE